MEKYCTAIQATDDNMAHVHCVMGTYGCKHILRLCNTYCFFTATMLTRTRVIISNPGVCSLFALFLIFLLLSIHHTAQM